MAWLTTEQIMLMGFAKIGERVYLSDKASFYNCPKISLAHDVRIDDFCILSAGAGGIEVGHHVHIAAYSSLLGAGKITLMDFSGLSSRVGIYSSNEDYSGRFMTNPTVPQEYKNVLHAAVTVGSHAIVGANSMVLPGVTIGHGAAVGAMSLVKSDCNDFGIYTGVPAKHIGTRKHDFLEMGKKLDAELSKIS